MITSERSTTLTSENVVTVVISWDVPPVDCDVLTNTVMYTGDQLPPYPAERRNTANDSVFIMGDVLTIEDALPYAVYTVTIHTLDGSFDLLGPSTTQTNRTLSIGEFCMHG